MGENTQYRVTSPGGYEQFYADYDEALKHFQDVPNATLEYGNESTGHKWVVLRSPDEGEFKQELRNLLKFD